MKRIIITAILLSSAATTAFAQSANITIDKATLQDGGTSVRIYASVRCKNLDEFKDLSMHIFLKQILRREKLINTGSGSTPVTCNGTENQVTLDVVSNDTPQGIYKTGGAYVTPSIYGCAPDLICRDIGVAETSVVRIAQP